MRSFLAVPLPEAVRARLHEVEVELGRGVARVAWVRAENLHVTLRFLGSVDVETLARVEEALAVATGRPPPFTVTVGGLGVFPTPRAPRVLWAGVTDGGDALRALHGEVETALVARGIPPEGRPFHPHVTLGRARDPRGAPGLAAAVGRTETFGQVRVDHVWLVRSDLEPGGARYRVLARQRLGGDAADPSPSPSGPEGVRVDFIGGGP